MKIFWFLSGPSTAPNPSNHHLHSNVLHVDWLCCWSIYEPGYNQLVIIITNATKAHISFKYYYQASKYIESIFYVIYKCAGGWNKAFWIYKEGYNWISVGRARVSLMYIDVSSCALIIICCYVGFSKPLLINQFSFELHREYTSIFSEPSSSCCDGCRLDILQHGRPRPSTQKGSI